MNRAFAISLYAISACGSWPMPRIDRVQPRREFKSKKITKSFQRKAAKLRARKK